MTRWHSMWRVVTVDLLWSRGCRGRAWWGAAPPWSSGGWSPSPWSWSPPPPARAGSRRPGPARTSCWWGWRRCPRWCSCWASPSSPAAPTPRCPPCWPQPPGSTYRSLSPFLGTPASESWNNLVVWQILLIIQSFNWQVSLKIQQKVKCLKVQVLRLQGINYLRSITHKMSELIFSNVSPNFLPKQHSLQFSPKWLHWQRVRKLWPDICNFLILIMFVVECIICDIYSV